MGIATNGAFYTRSLSTLLCCLNVMVEGQQWVWRKWSQAAHHNLHLLAQHQTSQRFQQAKPQFGATVSVLTKPCNCFHQGPQDILFLRLLPMVILFTTASRGARRVRRGLVGLLELLVAVAVGLPGPETPRGRAWPRRAGRHRDTAHHESWQKRQKRLLSHSNTSKHSKATPTLRHFPTAQS